MTLPLWWPRTRRYYSEGVLRWNAGKGVREPWRICTINVNNCLLFYHHINDKNLNNFSSHFFFFFLLLYIFVCWQTGKIKLIIFHHVIEMLMLPISGQYQYLHLTAFLYIWGLGNSSLWHIKQRINYEMSRWTVQIMLMFLNFLIRYPMFYVESLHEATIWKLRTASMVRFSCNIPARDVTGCNRIWIHYSYWTDNNSVLEEYKYRYE